MTVRLTLICQGSTAANRKACFPGGEALEQSARIALAASDRPRRSAGHVHVSPASSARQTAEILTLGGQVDEQLREVDFGRWSGHTIESIAKEESGNFGLWRSDAHFAGHGGESLEAMAGRVRSWLAAASKKDGQIVAVTHSSLIRAAIVDVVGAPFEAFWRIDVSPMSVSELRHDGRRWALRSLGCPLPRLPPAVPASDAP